jgi:hypothetical protein
MKVFETRHLALNLDQDRARLRRSRLKVDKRNKKMSLTLVYTFPLPEEVELPDRVVQMKLEHGTISGHLIDTMIEEGEVQE